MKEDKNNILTDKEKEEFQKLKWLEKFWKLIWKELSEENKEKLNNYKKRLGELMGEDLEDNREIPQELVEFREMWKEKIEFDHMTKEKIVKAAEKIPLKVKVESDWSRLIKFKLWNKVYKILDPYLKNHTDYDYGDYTDWSSLTITGKSPIWVQLQWMLWDNINEWNNMELAEYVKDREEEDLHIPKVEEMLNLFIKLWKYAGLDNEDEEIAMLMYLTGMEWYYWLSMWDKLKSWWSSKRTILKCRNGAFELDFREVGRKSGNLCMISESTTDSLKSESYQTEFENLGAEDIGKERDEREKSIEILRKLAEQRKKDLDK